jgi:type IV fimbrial biogenesis protein FimT
MRSQAAFTVIEVMIAVAILSILLVLGVPAMRGVVENGRIRAAGESWKYGLTLARTEAIRRNAQVQFVDSAAGWQVSLVQAGTVLHVGSARESSKDLILTILPNGADRVTFSSLGQVVSPNPDGSQPITRVDISSVTPPVASGYHPLRIQMLSGGMTRLCDPAVPGTDSRACL